MNAIFDLPMFNDLQAVIEGRMTLKPWPIQLPEPDNEDNTHPLNC